jgi:hypothetical protein
MAALTLTDAAKWTRAASKAMDDLAALHQALHLGAQQSRLFAVSRRLAEWRMRRRIAYLRARVQALMREQLPGGQWTTDSLARSHLVNWKSLQQCLLQWQTSSGVVLSRSDDKRQLCDSVVCTTVALCALYALAGVIEDPPPEAAYSAVARGQQWLRANACGLSAQAEGPWDCLRALATQASGL